MHSTEEVSTELDTRRAAVQRCVDDRAGAVEPYHKRAVALTKGAARVCKQRPLANTRLESWRDGACATTL